MAGTEAFFSAMAVPGRARLLLIDGPWVLGHDEMNRIDRETGGATLRDGLAHALSSGALKDVPLEPLTDVLSAAFDRAALAIAEGNPPAEYEAAIRSVIEGLFSHE